MGPSSSAAPALPPEAEPAAPRDLRGVSSAPASAATPVDRPHRLVLLGNPNVGKSALFGALTGTYVTVSNYPGTTVEITTGSAIVGGRKTPITDTPGVASFLPASEDERVTRDILLADRATGVLVSDAKNLERGLVLAVQLAEMGVPFVLALNMLDEAGSRGIDVDLGRLSSRLGVPVVGTVAIRRQGISQLLSAVDAPRTSALAVSYPPEIEAAARKVEPTLPAAPLSPRSLALMALAGDETLAEWLAPRMAAPGLERLETVRRELQQRHHEPVAYVIQQARQKAAAALAAEVTTREVTPTRARRLAGRFEALSTHPFWGFPILLGVLYLAYLFVGVLGAGTLVDLLEDGLFGKVINPATTSVVNRFVPFQALRDFLVGPYGVVTMALTYSLALILPIVGTFFIAFGILEDSGYLPRLAVMSNRVFRAMGLNGKAILPMILGLGCDTMATLTTRVLETKKERLVVTLLLALGVPCSAQLAVVLTMLTALPKAAMLIWLGVVLGVIFVVGRLASIVLPGAGSDFVLELPPMRLPQVGNIAVKTLARIEWYLKEAVPLFVLGTFILFVADALKLLGGLQRLAQPVVGGLLGLPLQAADAFVIGFLRRDFGAAGLYKMSQEGLLDPIGVLVATVTITLFVPCIANFFMMVKEQGWRKGVAILAFVTPLAIGVGAVLNWTLRAFPGALS